MPLGDRRADVVRRIRGIEGEVEMRDDLRIRFDYAAALPWVRKVDERGRPGARRRRRPGCDRRARRRAEGRATHATGPTSSWRKGDELDIV